MKNVVDAVTKIVNFIRARALNHRQFVALLEENEAEHGDISYHCTVRWLSLGKVLKSVWDLRDQIQEFCRKVMTSQNFQITTGWQTSDLLWM